MAKLNQYYEHLAELDAHILAMGTFLSPLWLLLTRVHGIVVLNPKKKMAHFTKHWPADVVEEVKSVVCECVSSVTSVCLCTLLTVFSLKFVEHFKARNADKQDQVEHVHKVAAPHSKHGHQNVDNTNSSSSDEDYPEASSTVNYLEEFNLYLNTNEIVPDDISIVSWWGVHQMLLFHHQRSYTFLVVWGLLPNMAITCS